MRKGLLQAVAFLTFAMLLWLAWELGIKRNIERGIVARVDAARLDEATKRQTDTVAKVDTLYRTEVRNYPVFRDRLIAANPGNKPLQELAGRCNQLVVTCEQRVRAGDVLTDTLRAQVAALKKVKAISPPRFTAFTEAGYDLINREPVVRLGGDMRLFGPLSLGLTGEASAGMGESQQRVLIGGKFTFR